MSIVKITEELILQGVCGSARMVVAPLLPTHLSTEAMDNIESADKLINRYRDTVSCDYPECGVCRRYLGGDLHWIIRKMAKLSGMNTDQETEEMLEYIVSIRNNTPTSEVVSNILAHLARLTISYNEKYVPT